MLKTRVPYRQDRKGKQKVCITGGFPSIRNAFLNRGWTANDDVESDDWDLKYTIRKRDIDFNKLEDWQVVNYFPANHEYTTKISLTTNLNTLCWIEDVESLQGESADVDDFYPRCYNLSVDTDSFVEEFKRGKCLAILKQFARSRSSSQDSTFPPDAVEASLDVLNRKLVPFDMCLLHGKDSTEYLMITNAEWNILKDVDLMDPSKELPAYVRKRTVSKSLIEKQVLQPNEGQKTSQKKKKRTSSCLLDDRNTLEDLLGRRRKRSSRVLESEVMMRPEDHDNDEEVVEPILVNGQQEEDTTTTAENDSNVLFSRVLDCLSDWRQKDPQFSLYGEQNLWILKPAGKSRGRGIFVTNRLEEALDCARGQEALWMSQKYIENPQLVNTKEADAARMNQFNCSSDGASGSGSTTTAPTTTTTDEAVAAATAAPPVAAAPVSSEKKTTRQSSGSPLKQPTSSVAGSGSSPNKDNSSAGRNSTLSPTKRKRKKKVGSGKKKFDVRQWILITNWQPLSIWFYNYSYLRFGFDDYDEFDMGNRFSHLTNYSVAKHAHDFQEKKDETMWDCDHYRDWLNNAGSGPGQCADAETFLRRRKSKQQEEEQNLSQQEENNNDKEEFNFQLPLGRDGSIDPETGGVQFVPVVRPESPIERRRRGNSNYLEEGEVLEEVLGGEQKNPEPLFDEERFFLELQKEEDEKAGIVSLEQEEEDEKSILMGEEGEGDTINIVDGPSIVDLVGEGLVVEEEEGPPAPLPVEQPNNSSGKVKLTVEEEARRLSRLSPGWKRHQRQAARNHINNDRKPDIDLWLEHIQPQMKRIVYLALESCQERMLLSERKNCFEFVGFDFMVDTDLKVWLIEINSSPDLSYSTQTTKDLVKEVLPDMVKVVLDCEEFTHKRRSIPCNYPGGLRWTKAYLDSVDTGGWELLYREKRRAEQKILNTLPNLESIRDHLVLVGKQKKIYKAKKKLKSLKSVVDNLIRRGVSKRLEEQPEANGDEGAGDDNKGDGVDTEEKNKGKKKKATSSLGVKKKKKKKRSKSSKTQEEESAAPTKASTSLSSKEEEEGENNENNIIQEDGEKTSLLAETCGGVLVGGASSQSTSGCIFAEDESTDVPPTTATQSQSQSVTEGSGSLLLSKEKKPRKPRPWELKQKGGAAVNSKLAFFRAAETARKLREQQESALPGTLATAEQPNESPSDQQSNNNNTSCWSLRDVSQQQQNLSPTDHYSNINSSSTAIIGGGGPGGPPPAPPSLNFGIIGSSAPVNNSTSTRYRKRSVVAIPSSLNNNNGTQQCGGGGIIVTAGDGGGGLRGGGNSTLLVEGSSGGGGAAVSVPPLPKRGFLR